MQLRNFGTIDSIGNLIHQKNKRNNLRYKAYKKNNIYKYKI
jgi:hypothetical protein